ncbi:MAG: outer membrane beta-barrel protein [Cyclobacteriaceae bacterium]|nr:outer membrane beta-barrel protein [Cyclobacteriaceae bacterium]
MKIFTVAMLVILLNNVADAQTKLGIKVTPSVVSQRITNPMDTAGINPANARLSFPMMAIADICIGKNYYFSTGVGFISRRMRFEKLYATEDETIDLRVQYLQIPATLKLFTDEVALDKRLYFQFGPVVEFKLHERTVQGSLPEDFVPGGGNITMLFAAGMNVLVSPNTAIEVGLNYSRGLINIFEYSGMTEDIPNVRSDLFGIDITVKF